MKKKKEKRRCKLLKFSWPNSDAKYEAKNPYETFGASRKSNQLWITSANTNLCTSVSVVSLWFAICMQDSVIHSNTDTWTWTKFSGHCLLGPFDEVATGKIVLCMLVCSHDSLSLRTILLWSRACDLTDSNNSWAAVRDWTASLHSVQF